MSASSNRKRKLTNLFGGLGYLSVLFQWLFVAVLVLPVFLESETYVNILEPTTPVEQPVSEPAVLTGGIWVFVTFAIALVFIALTVILLLKIPASIAKTGHDITEKSAKSITPIVIKNRKLKPSEQTKLTARLVKLIKLLLVTVPVALVCLTYFTGATLDIYSAIFVGCLLAILSLVLFSVQYLLAKLFKLQPKYLL